VNLAVEVSIVDCAITDMIAADQNINDKVVIAIKTKVHKFDMGLLFSCDCRRRTEQPVLRARCARHP